MFETLLEEFSGKLELTGSISGFHLSSDRKSGETKNFNASVVKHRWSLFISPFQPKTYFFWLVSQTKGKLPEGNNSVRRTPSKDMYLVRVIVTTHCYVACLNPSLLVILCQHYRSVVVSRSFETPQNPIDFLIVHKHCFCGDLDFFPTTEHSRRRLVQRSVVALARKKYRVKSQRVPQLESASQETGMHALCCRMHSSTPESQRQGASCLQ